jgi:meso-butanediol dehydrogenase/(S,S)-butanediol dehydrogenase/diacetyl reductase
MMGKLHTAQAAIVTGGGQGIGRAIALRLSQDGMKVLIADRQGDLAENVAHEVRAAGGSAQALTVDVTVAADRQRMIDSCLEYFQRFDVLVNNAAVQRVSLPLEVSEEHWDLVMNVNAKSVYFCCQLALIQMVAQHSGHIVNMASAAGKLATTIYHPVYNASKAAVIAMTRTLAYACASDGVRVNAVCPGIIETPMQALVDREFSVVTGKDAATIRAERLSKVPLGQIGKPEDVAAVVSFLVGPDSNYMTGQAINVTGGMVLV